MKTVRFSHNKMTISSMFSLLLIGTTTIFSPGVLVQGMEMPSPTIVLKDYSGDAINLFNNMRTPAAMITGGLVPLGVLSAPTINDDDTKMIKILKKANVLLGVMSLLSEIIAVTYASIAINKLVELPSPQTQGVAELILQNHELAWLGTNIHFLLGMMGFGLLVGNRVYFQFGNPIGQCAIGFSIAFFFQAISVVNKGIAMGSATTTATANGVTSRFASNLFFLTCRYISAALRHAGRGVCGIGALWIAMFTIIRMAVSFYEVCTSNRKSAKMK